MLDGAGLAWLLIMLLLGVFSYLVNGLINSFGCKWLKIEMFSGSPIAVIPLSQVETDDGLAASRLEGEHKWEIWYRRFSRLSNLHLITQPSLMLVERNSHFPRNCDQENSLSPQLTLTSFGMLHAHHIKSVSFSRYFQFQLLPLHAINAGEWSLDRIALTSSRQCNIIRWLRENRKKSNFEYIRGNCEHLAQTAQPAYATTKITTANS